MLKIVPLFQKDLSYSEYFDIVREQWGTFSFEASSLRYAIYTVFGLASLIVFVVLVKKISSYLKDKKGNIPDLPYLLRNLSSRIDHFKIIISEKTTFTCRLLNDVESRYYDGQFSSIDEKNNVIIRLSTPLANPQDYVNNSLEIKYSFKNDRTGIITSTILKYLGSKKSKESSPIYFFLINLPESIKLEQKRKDVRFKTLPDFPIRAYLLSDKIDIPIACKCIDFSVSGIRVELIKAKAGCLEYFYLKEKFVCENRISSTLANQLTFPEILSKSHFENDKFEIFKHENWKKWANFIDQAKIFLSSLSKKAIVDVFFILPALPLAEGKNKEILSQENRTIQCKAIVTTITKGDSLEKRQVALNFLKTNYMIQDIIYQYGLAMWRLKQTEEEVSEELSSSEVIEDK